MLAMACFLTPIARADGLPPSARWTRQLPFAGRSLTARVRQILVTSDSPPRLWSLDKKDGKLAWSLTNPLGSTSNPFQWNNLLLLFPNSSCLQALNPDSGELVWQLGPPFPPIAQAEAQRGGTPSVTQRILARPLRLGNRILCLRGDGSLVEVNAENRTNILMKLESPLSDDVFVTRPAILGGRLWACSRRGYLQEVNLESTEVSQAQVLQTAPPRSRATISADLTVFQDRLLIASEEGTIFSLRPSQPTENWKISLLRNSEDAFSSRGALLFVPLHAGPDQCLLTSRQELRCLGTEKGETRWSLSLPQGISSRPYCRQIATPEGGTLPPKDIFVTTEDSRLLQVSTSDGSLQRTWNLPCPSWAHPLADEQDVFVALTDGTVLCFPLASR